MKKGIEISKQNYVQRFKENNTVFDCADKCLSAKQRLFYNNKILGDFVIQADQVRKVNQIVNKTFCHLGDISCDILQCETKSG